ncbi:alpha/beta fold hydrolase [Aquimarina brevivitae]|uniref:Pimeloyl-ACP methyl ester carboxylesterase n=1 Tax=Aquimarina brevivitae TaxID=323412 RepID=A0A4Q7P4L6_9FLAO|nr:alpha/beta hydrolase [Aquimarina brevivitae]RZS93632.1 pimeloyl-ACP methyl ester carboxylesterase [Aquimarina brevivitae]
MPFITHETKEQNVDLYFKDYGHGQPVVLIHGWPLSHRAWEQQIWAVVEAGYRCIAYDRRGFGHSDEPWDGFDYSTLASDLHSIITKLELKDAILVGFSMGGGEVVRYCTDYGTDNISKVALISSIIPLVAQKPDNPDGVPQKELDNIMKALQNDRVDFLTDFHKNFYNYDQLKDRVSQAQLEYDWTIAAEASPRATIQAAKAWAETDFRSELKNVNVPCLIVHGDADNIVPIETSADQAAKHIENNTYKIIKNAPHGLNVTHKHELNDALLSFIKQDVKELIA